MTNVKKNPGVGRNIDLSSNNHQKRGKLSVPVRSSNIAKCTVCQKQTFCSLKREFKGTYSQDIVTTMQTKRQGKYVTLGQNSVSLMENSCWF